jgi:hypothetical protein
MIEIIIATALALFSSAASGDLQPAVRGEAKVVNPVNAPPPPSLFAPAGLTGCDEMNWYRVVAGLPEAFAGIGWRESNCRNEDAVRTSCCHGYWQMYTSLHLQDHRLAPHMEACGVRSHEDLNSDTPEDKLRQACAAKALYDVSGTYPWVATR